MEFSRTEKHAMVSGITLMIDCVVIVMDSKTKKFQE